MKKFFYSFFAAVTLMFAASSCSSEDVIENGTSTGDAVEVSFNLEMEGQTASRAIGDGLTVDEVIMAVYDESGTEISNLRTTGTVDNLGAVVKVRLVKGQTYQFVFWAQKSGNGYYGLTDMTKITVDYTGNANDETRDAFYAYVDKMKVTGSFSKNVTLKRPFAQLNLGTTAEDIAWAKNAGVEITKSTVKVSNVYSTLNTFVGTVSDEKVVKFTAAAIPDAETEELVIKDDKNQFENDYYEYLASDYLLMNESENTSVTYELYAGETLINTLTVENAPLQRNWRTNIVGEILTGEGTFNIVIDPIFEADRNYPMDGSDLDIWDGKTTEPELVDGVYIIDQASDLIGLATMDESKLKGATFSLTKDLSFKNKESRTGDTTPSTIEPLFDNDSKNNGPSGITFLGNNHVIRDFVIEKEDGKFNSLFGAMLNPTIKDLTIINADVKGANLKDHYASVLVAKITGKATIDNVTIKDSKLIGVQKIAGLIGFITENKGSVITNCSVEGLTLSNYDYEKESGSTAGLIGAISAGKASVQNCYVKNSNLNLIQAQNIATRANSQFIGVIRGGVTLELINCDVEGNTFENSIEWTPYNDPFVGGKDGARTTLMVDGITSCATIDEVAAALNEGKDVTLGADIVSEKPIFVNEGHKVTLNLNGKKISAGSTFQYTSDANGDALIRVSDGSTVTITGDGIVDASTFNGGIMAVWVRGSGNVIIENGTFKVGNDEQTSTRNDMIYISGNNPESTIVINGGVFEYVGEYDGKVNARKGWLYTLNANNDTRAYTPIIVNGGTFYQFIPGTTNPDGWKMEHALGEGKNVYKDNESTATTDTNPAEGAWYTVK